MQQISAFTGGGMGRKYKRLSVDDIHVLWSRWFQGDTSVQISAVLGCDTDTVTWHVVRGGGVRPPERRRAARHLMGPGQGDGAAQAVQYRDRRAGVLLRPAESVAARVEREHERPVAAILSEGNGSE